MGPPVASRIVDISKDRPRPTDVILVDTSVWLLIVETPKRKRRDVVEQYFRYLRRADTAGTTLVRSDISFSEMAHVIEREYRQVYDRAQRDAMEPSERGRYQDIDPKAYRGIASERVRVVESIESGWGMVKDWAPTGVETSITGATGDALLARLKSEDLDAYDALLVETATRLGIDSILSDDGDYATVNGITLFTWNQSVLGRAGAQLLRRSP